LDTPGGENARAEGGVRETQALDRRSEKREHRQAEPERLRAVIELDEQRHAIAEQVVASKYPGDDRRVLRVEQLDGEVVGIDLVHVHAGQIDVPGRDRRVDRRDERQSQSRGNARG
jgi:hypothetical protein